jgi:hypothetical protein
MGAPLVVYLAVVAVGYDGNPFLRGDCEFYYQTARSILLDHDLDLSNQMPDAETRHVNQVSEDRAGRVVPKHPVLMPIASMPFVALEGRRGALYFNLVQITLLSGVMYLMARRAAGPGIAAAAAVGATLGSFLPHYAWNYSPDVFSTLLLVGGLAFLSSPRGDPRVIVAGALLLGLSLWAKQSLVVFLPTALLVAPAISRRTVLALAAGLALGLFPFLALNASLFGSPFVTAYDRIIGGGHELYSQKGAFALPFREGAWGQFADQSHGLLLTSPVTLAALAGFVPLARRQPRLALGLALGMASLYALFSVYWDWATSHYGNRFLMPIVALAAVPLAALLEWADERRPARQARNSVESM